MKRIAFAVCVAVLVFGVAILAKSQTGSVEQELIKLENEWAQCQVKPDFALLDRILADDYTWTTSSGKVRSKADEIASYKSENEIVDSAVNDEMKVRVYGDAAVVTFRTTYKWTEKGKQETALTRFTDTWVKIAGRWQVVACHGSDIPQK